MEVNKNNFFWALPGILEDIQKSRFVAIDVEMSGISSTLGHASQKESMQDAYTKAKDAAENFQVLQIGFTFGRFDERSSEYVTRTYSCYVSPLIPKGSFPDGLARHLDRKFSISLKSYEFLRHHKFDFMEALDNGIPYLSREEQKYAHQFFSTKDSNNDNIDLSTLDVASRQFCYYVKERIEAFVGSGCPKGKETIIKNPFGDKLNGLQIRLIHQLLRQNFPGLAAKKILTGPMTGLISIIPADQAENEANTRRRQKSKDAASLSGLQIIFEALSGGSFADAINPDWTSQSPWGSKGRKPDRRHNTEKFDFKKCEAKLKQNRPILVGHNMFYDLAFIYHTFFEPLPEKVDDFLTRIHGLFPRIVDTKFMHMKGKSMMAPRQALHDLHAAYSTQQFPVVRNVKSPGTPAAGPHNAGYDSSSTATLFLKQSYTTFMKSTSLELETQDDSYKPNAWGPQGLGQPSRPAATSSYGADVWGETGGATLLERDEAETKKSLQKWTVLSTNRPTSRFAMPAAPPAVPKPLPQTQAKPAQARSEPMSGEIYSQMEEYIIPPWTHGFWRAYGNKTSVPGIGGVSFV